MPCHLDCQTAQTELPDADPDQFAGPPKQREGDVCDIEVTEDSHEEHIPGTLGPRLLGMMKLPSLIKTESALTERRRMERKLMPVTAMI